MQQLADVHAAAERRPENVENLAIDVRPMGNRVGGQRAALLLPRDGGGYSRIVGSRGRLAGVGALLVGTSGTAGRCGTGAFCLALLSVSPLDSGLSVLWGFHSPTSLPRNRLLPSHFPVIGATCSGPVILGFEPS